MVQILQQTQYNDDMLVNITIDDLHCWMPHDIMARSSGKH